MRQYVFIGLICMIADALFAGEVQHPRLFVTPDRVKRIQEQSRLKGSHHQLALAELKARVDNPDDAAAYGASGGYVPGYRAVEASFLSALAENDDDRNRYAGLSYEALARWTNTGSATLGKSMEGRCLALAYDWAYPAWTDEQRAAMTKRVDAVLRSLGSISHSNLGGDRTSNFVGVIRGAELLLQLSSGEDVGAERVRLLIGELKRYFDHAFGDLGACQEGPGYTEYPGPFAFGAAFAARECGDATLYDTAAKHAFWKMLMYTRTVNEKANLSLMWGVSGGADYTEGWASQIFQLCPAEQLPYYVWWYDRNMGRLTPERMAHRFDGDRHGTVWALLFYPADVTPKDPTGVLPPAVMDSRGYIFFRNHWRDSGAILVSLAAQVRRDQKGWNQPEQLAINLIADGNRFIGGPVKETKPEAYSSLLVDGKYTYKDATEPMGKVIAFEPSDAGGYAIVEGGQMYERLGVKQAVRHLRVDFLPDNRALVATLDRVKTAGGQHTYTWQANVGDGIAVEAGEESGRPFFLMKGANGAFLKGWVTHPAGAKIAAGDPLRVTVQGTDADIWVVMLAGRGQPPAAVAAGDGLDCTLSVAGAKVGLDAKSDRITTE